MKKLMIMLSAASLAIGLRAAEPYPSGSAFNGETLDDAALWSSTEGLSIDKEVTTVGYTKDRPNQFVEMTKGNSLKISTSLSAPVYRAIVAGATPQDIGTGVYVDTLVKFTAFDPDDEATITDTGAKLAVWVKEVEGETPSYQLMVTAGYVDGTKEDVTVQHYECETKSAINTDNWYRLTIKSIKNIDGDGLMGFVVFVDGVVVSCGASKFANVTLSQQAALWNDTGKLFPSLVKQDSKLKQVGFAGQGHIDDFSITDAAPSFAKDLPSFTVTGGDHVVSFTVGGKPWKASDKQPPLVFIVNAQAPKIAENIVYEAGYFGDKTYELVNIEDGAAFKVGNAQELAATVTIGDTETQFSTLAAAVKAINAADANVTLKLGKPAAGITLNNTNANVTNTIDLAGQTITQGAEDTAAIYVVSGNVVVDDTVGGGTVQGNEDASLIALVVSEGSATLNKGIYNGVVGGVGLAIPSADVKILASANPEGVEATLPNGLMLQEGKDGYLSLVATKPGTWEEVTGDTQMTDLPGVTAEVAGALTEAGVTVSAVKTWATGSGAVVAGAPINLDAFVMDAANAATPADLAAQAAAEITQAVLDAIVAAGTGADLSAIAAKYPNATVTVVPATELTSTETAKFFKLKFVLKGAQ